VVASLTGLQDQEPSEFEPVHRPPGPIPRGFEGHVVEVEHHRISFCDAKDGGTMIRLRCQSSTPPLSIPPRVPGIPWLRLSHTPWGLGGLS